MKLLIDIDEKEYKEVKEFMVDDGYLTPIEIAVSKGIPLEEIPNPCIECSQNCCVCELNGEKCDCQKVYVLKEINNEPK